MHLAAQNNCMLVAGKEASPLSTLHGIAIVLKTGQEKLYPPTYITVSVAAVPHTYFRSSLRILFTVFLETKTQLGN